ncbi:MAG: GH3 auxin-responsive promoter family protein [Nitrospira sp.]|nr:MAG: GH3 auxin-responsive promoter family protein [Nitrospira sp.]
MFVPYALAFIGRRLWRQFDSLTFTPRATQEQWLMSLLRRNQDTLFGRTHSFGRIRSVEDYRASVQPADYEAVRPYVRAIIEGRQRVLTAEAPFMFNLTSGTTERPKLIPVTRSAAAMNACLTTLWLYRTLVDHPDLLAGPFLFLAGAPVEGHTPGGLPYGAATGLALASAPWLLKRQHVIPGAVLEITDYDTKYYLTMRLALEHRLSFIVTPNPGTLIRLAETADTRKEEMIRDIRDGTLSDCLDLGAAVLERVKGRLKPNARRASELAHCVEEYDALRPQDYWPELQVIGCWKGGSLGTQLTKLDRWFSPGTPVRDLGYLASEAHGSLPISDSGADGVLALDSNFYEFLPEEDRDKVNPHIVTCDELETGKTYYVLLTTPAGLYRYDINDVVSVTGYYRNTPVIEFLRKGRSTSMPSSGFCAGTQISGLDSSSRSWSPVPTVRSRSIMQPGC